MTDQTQHTPEELPDLDHSPAPVPRPSRKWILPVIFGVAMLCTTALATGLLRFRPPWIMLPTRTTYYVDFKALADAKMEHLVKHAQARNQTSLQSQDMEEFAEFVENIRQDAVEMSGGRMVLVKGALVDPGREGHDLTPDLAAKYGLTEAAANEVGTGKPQTSGARP